MALPVITLATSWQSLGVAQAIASAINRRCAVCGMPAIAVPDNTCLLYTSPSPRD